MGAVTKQFQRAHRHGIGLKEWKMINVLKKWKMSNVLKKVAVYRAISFVIGFVMSYLWFGTFDQSFLFISTTMAVMTVVHYFFERWWDDDA
jgi:uncharacterized membrane protein